MGSFSVAQYSALPETTIGTVLFIMTVPDLPMVKSALVTALSTLGFPDSWEGDETDVSRAANYGSYLFESLLQYEIPPVTTIPIGTILPFAGTSAPTGYLLCQGQLVSRSTYSALFALIGTSYGPGDGSTTFQIPDGRGTTLVGAGQAFSGGTTWNVGVLSGTERITLSINEMPQHSHYPSPTSASGSRPYLLAAGTGTGNTTPLTTYETFPAGGNQSHNNMQPSQVIGGFIIYTGV